MGHVFRAQDLKLNRPVALKRLRGEFAGSGGVVRRFLSEAQAAAGLNHPHIVQVYDFGRDRDGYHIAMELVEGESLADLLRRKGKLELAEGLRIGQELCAALEFAHARGIVHRDIKPANVLLEASTGRAKLGDFGLARLTQSDDGQTRAGTVLGTLDFMSPEQRIDATKVDARSDLWSVGATLYQAFTGRSPRIINASHLPEAVRDVVLETLEESPEDRPGSAGDLSRRLRELGGGNRPQVAGPSSATFQPVGARSNSVPPGDVRIREANVAPLKLKIDPVRQAPALMIGLPPVLAEMLSIQGELAGVRSAIPGLEDQTHVSLAPAKEEIRVVEESLRLLRDDLRASLPNELPLAVADSPRLRQLLEHRKWRRESSREILAARFGADLAERWLGPKEKEDPPKNASRDRSEQGTGVFADLQGSLLGVVAQKGLTEQGAGVFAELLAEDPRQPLSELCELAPERPMSELLPLFQRLRNVIFAWEAVNRSHEEYDRQRQAKIEELKQLEKSLLQQFELKCELDLRQVTEALWQRSGKPAEFPLGAWIEFEGRIMTRGYPWQAREVLSRAEKYFRQTRATAAGTAKTASLGTAASSQPVNKDPFGAMAAQLPKPVVPVTGPRNTLGKRWKSVGWVIVGLMLLGGVKSCSKEQAQKKALQKNFKQNYPTPYGTSPGATAPYSAPPTPYVPPPQNYNNYNAPPYTPAPPVTPYQNPYSRK